MSKKISCIYKITSTAKPERVYIGSTYWFQHRKWRHTRSFKLGNHPNKKLMNHVAKHGIEDMLFEIIEEVIDKSLLKATEQKYIDSLNPWFNLLPNAHDNSGFKQSDETKAKIGSKHKGKRLSEETKAKISAARKGTIKSDEEKKRMSEYRKGRKRGPFSEEWKRNLSLAHIGKDSNTKGWETRRMKMKNNLA